MKDSKEKDLNLKEKELEANPNAEALEADRELSEDDLNEVSGGNEFDKAKGNREAIRRAFAEN